MRRERTGVSEIVSSLSMLMVTIAVLGGVSVLSLASVNGASNLLTSGTRRAADGAGVLLTVASTQSNSSGTFVWLLNYGWSVASLPSVYANGGLIPGWKSNCASVAPEELCAFRLPAGTNGTVTFLFEGSSISVSL